jgi:hypothetical protein
MHPPMAKSIDWAQGLPLTAGDYFLGIYQPSPETVGYWEGVASIRPAPARIRTAGMPWRAVAADNAFRSPPDLGQHTQEILAELAELTKRESA